jgi:hypothetical protein
MFSLRKDYQTETGLPGTLLDMSGRKGTLLIVMKIFLLLSWIPTRELKRRSKIRL